MIRVSTFAQYTRNLNFMTLNQARLQDLQTQIGSGMKSQDFKGLGREVGRLLEVEESRQRTNQYVENINVVGYRLETMEANVSQIFDIMLEYKTLLVNALNASNAKDLNLPIVTQNMLDQITLLLNADFNGRFLFSGSRTDVEPVDPTLLPGAYVIPTLDGDSSAYYQGDARQLTARADDALVVTYGINADALGFERAIRSLDVVRTGIPTDRPTLDHALSVANQAINDITDLRTSLGATAATLDRIEQKHNDFLLFTERTLSDIENVDIAAAMTMLSTTQTTLEASFATMARLQRTTLLNFLN